VINVPYPTTVLIAPAQIPASETSSPCQTFTGEPYL
jgi:hypothetical protein